MIAREHSKHSLRLLIQPFSTLKNCLYHPHLLSMSWSFHRLVCPHFSISPFITFFIFSYPHSSFFPFETDFPKFYIYFLPFEGLTFFVLWRFWNLFRSIFPLFILFFLFSIFTKHVHTIHIIVYINVLCLFIQSHTVLCKNSSLLPLHLDLLNNIKLQFFINLNNLNETKIVAESNVYWYFPTRLFHCIFPWNATTVNLKYSSYYLDTELTQRKVSFFM